jgi:hypothetical protein
MGSLLGCAGLIAVPRLRRGETRGLHGLLYQCGDAFRARLYLERSAVQLKQFRIISCIVDCITSYSCEVSTWRVGSPKAT